MPVAVREGFFSGIIGIHGIMPHPMYSKLKLPDSNILQDTGCPVYIIVILSCGLERS